MNLNAKKIQLLVFLKVIVKSTPITHQFLSHLMLRQLVSELFVKKMNIEDTTGAPCKSFFLPIHICPSTEVIKIYPQNISMDVFILML